MSDLDTFLKGMLASVWKTEYRVRTNELKLNCPHPDYSKASITLPKEWLGAHAIKKAAAERFAVKFNAPEIAETIAALMMVEKFENIPGFEGDDPEQWHPELTPAPILAWISLAVIPDYMAAYKLPKGYSLPSGEDLKAPAANGNSKAMNPSSARTN